MGKSPLDDDLTFVPESVLGRKGLAQMADQADRLTVFVEHLSVEPVGTDRGDSLPAVPRVC